MSFIKDPAVLQAPIYHGYRLWGASLRFRSEGMEHVSRLVDAKQRVIVALWHNELFALPYFGLHLGYKFITVVSQSKDGEVLAQVLQRLDIHCCRGSKRSSGMRALLSFQRAMRDEERVGVVTVDGPRGPRHKAKDGIIYLAMKLDAWIVPVRLITPKAYVFEKAWDRFRLPLPFSTCTVRFGEPFRVQSDLSEEGIAAERTLLEERLAVLR